MSRHHLPRGFTLLEVILCIALISALSVGTILLSQIFQNRQEMQMTAGLVAQSLREARLKAITSDHDSAWSVKVIEARAMIFQGTDYAGRDQSLDEIIVLPLNITVSGSDTFTFEKFTGLPLNASDMTLLSESGVNINITVSEAGVINYSL